MSVLSDADLQGLIADLQTQTMGVLCAVTIPKVRRALTEYRALRQERDRHVAYARRCDEQAEIREGLLENRARTAEASLAALRQEHGDSHANLIELLHDTEARLITKSVAMQEAEASLAALRRQIEWQPIETVPKGRVVLMFAVTDRHEDGRVANWKKATGCFHTTGDLTWDGDRIDKPYQHRPTHWMLLPDSPVASDAPVTPPRCTKEVHYFTVDWDGRNCDCGRAIAQIDAPVEPPRG